ncbi:MAG: XRE family transcriptional regulator [Clostridia bacterium]|nr:XRE family transcriptional regulator [Clostridia bacterium]
MLLKNNGLKQKQLAQYVGIDEAQLSRCMNGLRTPKPDIIAKIAVFLNTTADYLIGDNAEAASSEGNVADEGIILARSSANVQEQSGYSADLHAAFNYVPEKITNERYEFIKRRVVELFRRYDIHCLPVNPFTLAKKLNIKTTPYSLCGDDQAESFWISLDGYCQKDEKGRWGIYFNDKVLRTRINYTIMHEIGHIVLDHTVDDPLAEKEADFFAKYTLCPPAILYRKNCRTPEDIMALCDVSKEAATYALDYCKKWVKYSGKYYTDYEVELIRLFESEYVN